MKSVRLAQFMRDSILQSLLTHAFEARRLAIEERKRQLADDVYHFVYTPEEEAAMRAMPSDFFPWDSGIKAKFGNGSGAQKFSYSTLHWRTGEKELRPIAYGHHASARFFADNHPLELVNAAIERDVEILKEEKDAATAQAKAVLYSVTTVKRLIEVWPEVEKFASKYLTYGQASQQRALSIPLTSLNQALGLPPQ